MKLINYITIDKYQVRTFLDYYGKIKPSLSQFKSPIKEHSLETLRFLCHSFKRLHKILKVEYIGDPTWFTVAHYETPINDLVLWYYNNHLQYKDLFQLRAEIENLYSSNSRINTRVEEHLSTESLVKLENKILDDSLCYDYYKAKQKTLDKLIAEFLNSITWLRVFKHTDGNIEALNKKRRQLLTYAIKKFLKSLR